MENNILDYKFNALRGNDNIKSAGSSVLLTASQYKTIATEIIRCKKDIIYFAENYFTIVSDNGKELIKLYPKQKELLLAIINNKNTIVLSSRQSGKSTTYTIFALWYTLFNRDKGILMCANKFATAIELMERIQLAYELLPTWLKLGCTTYRAGKIVFENGSKIECSATSASSARGKTGECITGDSLVTICENNILYQVPIEQLYYEQ